MKRLALFPVADPFAAPAWASGPSVTRAWVRHLPAGLPAGGFFALRNAGKRTQALVGASSPDYAMVMMHRTVERGGVSKMPPVARVELAPDGKVAFRPGGYHLMLTHAKRPIAVGAAVPVTLQFAHGRERTVRFDVRGPAAQ